MPERSEAETQLAPGAVQTETAVLFRFRQGQPYEAIAIRLEYRMEGARWLAECLELGTATYADSLKAVQAEIREFIETELNGMEEQGFVEQLLRDRKVSRIPVKPIRPLRKKVSWQMPAGASCR